jgi:bacterioferritin
MRSFHRGSFEKLTALAASTYASPKFGDSRWGKKKNMGILSDDKQEELGHSQLFGKRIKELYGTVPGSLDFKAEQSFLQPPGDNMDIVHVIKGVIEAENGGIEHYNKIIEFADEHGDPVTADMVTTILADEEGHKRLFEGFLREYERDG